MRCLHFTSISLSLVLFLCNHAHARLGATYEESVKRYTAAGFTEERTAEEIPPDHMPLGYFRFISNRYKKLRDRFHNPTNPNVIAGLIYQGLKEVTWTKKEPKEGTVIEVVSVRQLFYGEWPPTYNPGPWKPILRCFDIRYEFREPLKKTPSRNYPKHPCFCASEAFREWINQLFPSGVELSSYSGLKVTQVSHGCYGFNVRTERSPNNINIKNTLGEPSADGKYIHIRLGENQWCYKLPKPSLELIIEHEYQLHTKREPKEVNRQQEKKERGMPPPPPQPTIRQKIKKEFEESGL